MNKTAVAQQAKTAGFLPPHRGILQRKCACGNHTVAGGECAECAKNKSGLQRKLVIGASNDPLEREADQVADQVSATPSHSTVSGAPSRIQRYAGQATEATDTGPDSVDRVLASSGRPLESALRQDMEQRFGHDFSRVRVHSDGAAGQSARDVNAHAYTVGQNVVFGAEQFAPETHQGRRLLAHELTHVVQQHQGQSEGLQKQADNDVTEVLAEEEPGQIAEEKPQPMEEKPKATKEKPKKEKNPCTRTILAEGSCADLVTGSRFICCDPVNGIERKGKKTDIEGNACPGEKFTPIFTCDNKCTKALAKGCDDNDNWMAVPGDQFSKSQCGDVFTICANGKQTTGYVRDRSVTKSRFEVSPGIQNALGVTVGSSFKGAVFRPGAKQSLIDKDACCKS